jgi:hypothetical protein
VNRRDAAAAAGISAWDRLAHAVAQVVPPHEVDGVWIFDPLLRGSREWGTAVVSRIDGDRRRIYTARYTLAVKGKERGKFESTIEEVGTGPREAVARILDEAQRRMDDEHPPTSVPPDAWFASLPREAVPVDGPAG